MWYMEMPYYPGPSPERKPRSLDVNGSADTTAEPYTTAGIEAPQAEEGVRDSASPVVSSRFLECWPSGVWVPDERDVAKRQTLDKNT